MNRKSSAPMTRMAQMDLRWCTAGFFKAIPKRNGPNARLPGFIREFAYGSRLLRVSSTFRLGADDLSVLCSLAAMAGLLHHTKEKGRPASFKEARLRGEAFAPSIASPTQAEQLDLILEQKRTTERGIEIAQELTAQGKYFWQEATLNTLVQETGLSTSGSAFDSVASSLDRLSNVMLTDLGKEGDNARSRTRRIGDQLIAYSIKEGREKIPFLLNPRLVVPIMGGVSYATVDLDEMRTLPTEAAKILYVHLSSIKQREDQAFAISDLAKLVYGGTGSEEVRHIQCTPEQLKRWRHLIREKAIDVISKLPGWQVGYEAHNQDVRFRRPSMAPRSNATKMTVANASDPVPESPFAKVRG